MKAVKVALVVIAVFAVINWIRADSRGDWSLPQVLPLLGGHRPSIYDLAGLVMLGLAARALAKLRRAPRSDGAGESEYEEVKQGEDDETIGVGDEDDDGYGKKE